MPRDPVSGRDLHPDHMDRWPDDIREALEKPGDPRSVTGSSGQNTDVHNTSENGG